MNGLPTSGKNKTHKMSLLIQLSETGRHQVWLYTGWDRCKHFLEEVASEPRVGRVNEFFLKNSVFIRLGIWFHE